MKNLLKALAGFQQEVPTIHKSTAGCGYSYAELSTILEKINPLMQKHGLGFTQLLLEDKIKTIVFHFESGEQLESLVTIPKVGLKGMNDYQAFGSGVTYYRRYCISTMLGLVTDKDTDASGEQTKSAPVKQTLTDERLEKAITAIQEGKTTKEKVISDFQLTDVQLSKINELC
jgi:hypothetical protein